MIELTKAAQYEMENPEATNEREQAAMADVLEPQVFTCVIDGMPTILRYGMRLEFPFYFKDPPAGWWPSQLPVWLL